MGRPATKRRKTPEEKKKKDGTVYLNKKGVTMHCSVCGKDDHNKRGHGKYIERQMQEPEVEVEVDDEFACPEILQDILTQNNNHRLDPINDRSSMVYTMGQEERAHVTRMVPPGPLPEESSFVTDARDLIPQRRTNTTSCTPSCRA